MTISDFNLFRNSYDFQIVRRDVNVTVERQDVNTDIIKQEINTSVERKDRNVNIELETSSNQNVVLERKGETLSAELIKDSLETSIERQDRNVNVELSNEIDSVVERVDRNINIEIEAALGGGGGSGGVSIHNDLSGLQGGQEDEYYHLTQEEYDNLDCPIVVDISDTGVAEGNNSISGFANGVLIKEIKISTTTKKWTLTLYEKDDYTTREHIIVPKSLGNENLTIALDLVYIDQDGTEELHYTFTDEQGSSTHDIEVRGYKLKVP